MSLQNSTPDLARGQPVEDFFGDSWALYAHVLDHNYMFHEEIFRNVREFLQDLYSDRPFSILDLGCGSARHLARALQGLPVTRYRGYDLSSVAADHARNNLAGLTGEVEVRQGDLLEALRVETDTFDLVFSSFAVHHLLPQDKRELFRLAAACLSGGGTLLLIDVIRDEDEDRISYLDRYCTWLETSWITLPPAACAEVCTHIRERDFPETFSQLQQMATDAGFRPGAELPAFLFHRTLIWEAAGP